RQFEAAALFTAPLSGHMRLLDRGSSTSWQRACRAGKAWLLNRGFRDLYQRYLTGRLSNKAKKPRDNILKRAITLYHFASHSGEERQFVYQLNIEESLHVARIGPPDVQDQGTLEKNKKTQENLARVLPGGF